MNKTKIEWADMTWNVVTGCLHGCDYCYARRIAERFGLAFAPKLDDHGMEGACKYDSPEGMDTMLELNKPYYKGGRIQPYPMAFLPTFHRYRLNEPMGKTKSQKIFVCSMADLFGEWVPDEWIKEVFDACEAAPQHKYLFLTKNFLKASNYRYRDNWWIGRTITNEEDSSKLCIGDPWSIDGIHRANHFLSIEPLLSDVKYLKYYLYSFKWIIIGAQTGPRAVPPKPEWVQSIIDQCRAAGVPVFLKNNLNWPEKIQEWPEGLK